MCLIDDEQRGVIRNRRRAQQIRDFRGLRWENITPTDIDAYMDFKGTVMVFVEFKSGDVGMPRGQEMAFERLVAAVNASGYVNSIFIKASHTTPVDDDIASDLAIVTKVWDGKMWHAPVEGQNVKEVIDLYLKSNGMGWLL